MRPGVLVYRLTTHLGAALLAGVKYIGGLGILIGQALKVSWAYLFRPTSRQARKSLFAQMVRVGVKSIPIVCLVQVFIGVILALQMAPPLQDYGQEATISSVIGIAGFRMLGPIITAIVLSGFAGASIAAELGTMVVSEEIEAMRAMAMNPIRFLVVPRILATIIMMVLLAVVADLMIALGGYLASFLALGSNVYVGYWDRMRDALKYRDFFTGLVQAGVFGVLVAGIACFEGLRVRGGAAGVGRATTQTVVNSIVAIILASAVFTVIFYTLKL
jgi:phospholipid/cholesterol/gamma-HCH transport system permease protein